MLTGPLDQLDSVISETAREIVERASPIPVISGAAAIKAAEGKGLVRADIGQISGLSEDDEVPYGPPVGLEHLRELIAETWNRTFHLADVDGIGRDGLVAANVAITTGAAEALTLLFRIFAEHKTVLLPRGHWENYANGVALACGRVVVADYFDSDGQLNIEDLRSVIEAEGVNVVLSNFPANPTGAVLSSDEATRLGELARTTSTILIADEVYSRLRFDGQAPISLLTAAPERTITVTSASKEYLIPGARVGAVLCARSELTDQILRKMIRANSASPNTLGQRRLAATLEKDLEDLRVGQPPTLVSQVRDAMNERRMALIAVLKNHGFETIGRPGHSPMGTIFLMAALPSWWTGDDREFAEKALESHCVSVIPGSAFGLPGSVRFSYGGLDLQTIRQLDQNLKAFRAAI